MDWILFLALGLAAIVLFVRLLRWAQIQHTEARGHERIRSKRQRGLLAQAFDDIVSDIRKSHD